jgi:UDP:flavonoid glycosyltransferase YjiC (YdhE family)
MARYLLAASPLPGHVLPMLAIGRDLTRRGHDVRLLTGARFAGNARAAGLRHIALPTCCDYDARCLDATFPARRSTHGLARARFDVELLFVTFLAHQHRALQAALSAEETDAVLAETGFSGALPLLLGRGPRPPVLVCGVVPLMLSSADTPPFGTGWTPQRWRSDYRAMNWVVRRLLFRRTQCRLVRVLGDLDVAESPPFVLDWPQLADQLIQLTVAGFEYPRRDLPSTVTYAGPVLPTAGEEVPLPGWWPDLAGGRPVVHVTQGTVDNASLDRLITPTIRALAREDVLVAVSTGGRPPGTMPGPLPGNVRVAEFLPYDRLLPRVDVMVTNGGYGGVHCALAQGVPLVVAGASEEKPEIAARVRWSGVGVDLRTGTPTPRRLRRAVHTVLATRVYRARAQRLGAEIRAARPFDTIEAALSAVSRGRTARRDVTRHPAAPWPFRTEE